MKSYLQGGKVFWVTGLLALLAVQLAGCTASWQAPMERRGAPSRAAASVTARPASRTRGYYRVRRGDTLYSIAWRNNSDFRSLARWNGIRPPYVIYPGQLIRLRPVHSSARAKSVNRSKAQAGRASMVTTPSAVRKEKRVRATARGERPPRHPRPADRAHPAVRKAARTLRWNWPTKGSVVGRWRAGDPLRKGIKIAGKPGQPVRAAEAGKVVYSGSGLIGYGRLIIIKHNDNYLSAYGHNQKLLVRQGQRVTRGQKIAEMGRSNDGRTLLHFEIRRDGKPVDPLGLLPRR